MIETDSKNILQIALLRKRIAAEISCIIRLMKINSLKMFNQRTDMIDKLLKQHKNNTTIKTNS